MRYITILLAALAFLIACNTSCNVKENVQGPDNLETTQYLINTDRDTILQTKNGAFLKIPKGTLTTDNGSIATLDIKEVYSISQMIQGGLTTASNGDPLSSGGMIYINAAKGQHITFNQKIQVAIPADFLQKGMQLYKGEQGKDGTINWTDPAPLPGNKQTAIIDSGKILFESQCTSCHAIGHPLTGPDLAHFMKRFPPAKENYKYYMPHFFIGPTDSISGLPAIFGDAHNESDYEDYLTDVTYFCNLKNMFGSMGTDFSHLSKNSLLSIYRYIQNESDRLNLPMPGHAYLKDCTDSCKLYNTKTRELTLQQEKIKGNRQELINDNGPMVIVHPDTTWIISTLPYVGKEKVLPVNYEASYYQFDVSSFGWFNLDMLLKNVPGIVESELFVTLAGEYTDKVNTFLIIPSVKTYAEGGPAARNSQEFAFFYTDGKIPLPQNVPAYILAVTEGDDKIAFGLKQFTTSTSLELTVELHNSTKEEFTAAMKQFDVARLHIKVGETKNAGEIRKTDTILKAIDVQLKEAENLKPKRCDCNCNGYAQDSPIVRESK